MRVFKIIVILLWVLEAAYGIAKWIMGEYIHPAVFTFSTLAVVLLLLLRFIEEEMVKCD